MKEKECLMSSKNKKCLMIGSFCCAICEELNEFRYKFSLVDGELTEIGIPCDLNSNGEAEKIY